MIARIDRNDIDMLAVIARVCIGRDRLEITIDPKGLSTTFGVLVTGVDPDHLIFEAPFTLRRRGVETKLLLEGDAPVLTDVRHGDHLELRVALHAQTQHSVVDARLEPW